MGAIFTSDWDKEPLSVRIPIPTIALSVADLHKAEVGWFFLNGNTQHTLTFDRVGLSTVLAFSIVEYKDVLYFVNWEGVTLYHIKDLDTVLFWMKTGMILDKDFIGDSTDVLKI